MKFTITTETGRLDVFLTEKLDLSRSQIQKLIANGQILLNDKVVSSSLQLREGDWIDVDLDVKAEKEVDEKIAHQVEVIKKTKDYLVINKPAGLVVHNTKNMSVYTLADWLLEHYPEVKDVGEDELRPGIVHRLDKDVSGLMVVARTQKFFDNLKEQFKTRRVSKRYQGLAYGEILQDAGVITFPIARAVTRYKMAARPANAEGREAITEFHVAQHFINYTLLDITIKTGRTHQIRAHFSAYNHPLVGDNLYGTKTTRIKNKKFNLGRIWLVAVELGFLDPKDKPIKFEVDLPKDLRKFLEKVK